MTCSSIDLDLCRDTIPASIPIWTMGLNKRRIAKGENSKALKLDAYNTLRSGLSSILAFIGILLSAYFVQTDALAGIDTFRSKGMHRI